LPDALHFEICNGYGGSSSVSVTPNVWDQRYAEMSENHAVLYFLGLHLH
jgi:hypothetical protein